MQAPLEILLVEDNEGDVEITQRAFRDGKPPCRISVANDGLEALDFLRKRSGIAGAPATQLILLDLNMPRMDGKQFLENVKKDSVLKTIPVVMLTSSQSLEDIRACYERHASAYVVKPFEYEKFVEAVRQVVSFWSGLSRVP